MNALVIDNIPFELSARDILKHQKLDEYFLDEVQEIFDEAIVLAHPKAIFTFASVVKGDDACVNVGNVSFESRVLSINLNGINTVYPYVVTSGIELHNHAMSKVDDLQRYWVLAMAEMILHQANEYARNYIKDHFNLSSIYAMNPGSLPDWPTEQQHQLFSLLGDVNGLIGVELTESSLMMPIKSVSGIYFQSDEHYVNCKLCPRSECVGRREAFDPDLYMNKYGL